MAKKQKYASDQDKEETAYAPDTQGDVDAGEDSSEQADTLSEADDPTVEGSGKTAYVVTDGTIINGKYFPNSEARSGQEMIAYLSEDTAKELARCGMALKKQEDGSTVEAGESKEQPDQPPMDDQFRTDPK